MAGLDGRTRLTTRELTVGIERLMGALAREGYPMARLDSAVTKRTPQGERLNLFISEEPRAVAGEIRLTGGGDGDLPAPGSRLSERRLLELTGRILDDLNDSGFPYAGVTVTPASIIVQDEKLHINMEVGVERGPFIRLGEITFSGARVTKPRLLRLESRLERGNPFSRSALLRAEERLSRLPYIAGAGPARLVHEGPGVVGIDIPVRERRTARISGIMSLSPDASRPAGELKLELCNIMGSGRQLRFAWLGLNPHRQGVQASYREPWLFGKPWHGALQLEQWSEDTLATTTRYRLQAEWEPADRLEVSGALIRETISGGDSAAAASGSRALWLEGGLGFDRLDHPWNPSRGYSVSLTAATGMRRWQSASLPESRLRQEWWKIEAAQTVTPVFIAAGRIEARDISGDGVVIEELVRVGGTGSLRGYGEERLLARGALWGSAELRWRPDADGYIGLFGDGGYLYRTDARIQPEERHPASFGITAGVLTRAGRLGLDIGLAAGKPISQARLHVRLEGWF